MTAQQELPVGRRQRLLKNTITILFCAFGIYIAAPLVWIIINASKSNNDLFATFGFWFAKDLHFVDNVRAVLTYQDGIFFTWMTNTVLYSTAAAVGSTTLCLLAGYAFAKFEFRGRSMLFWSVVCAIMVPTTALAVPTYQLLGAADLINTMWAMILPSLVNPLGMYLMRLYVDSAVPDEVLDAARLDGAGEARILYSVVTRMVSPGLATVFLIGFVNTWNNYLLPLLVFNDVDLYPVTLGLTNWSRQSVQPTVGSDVLYPLVVSGSLLSVIPLVLAFLFLQRYWRSGLTLGAVR